MADHEDDFVRSAKGEAYLAICEKQWIEIANQLRNVNRSDYNKYICNVLAPKYNVLLSQGEAYLAICEQRYIDIANQLKSISTVKYNMYLCKVLAPKYRELVSIENKIPIQSSKKLSQSSEIVVSDDDHKHEKVVVSEFGQYRRVCPNCKRTHVHWQKHLVKCGKSTSKTVQTIQTEHVITSIAKPNASVEVEALQSNLVGELSTSSHETGYKSKEIDQDNDKLVLP